MTDIVVLVTLGLLEGYYKRFSWPFVPRKGELLVVDAPHSTPEWCGGKLTFEVMHDARHRLDDNCVEVQCSLKPNYGGNETRDRKFLIEQAFLILAMDKNKGWHSVSEGLILDPMTSLRKASRAGQAHGA